MKGANTRALEIFHDLAEFFQTNQKISVVFLGNLRENLALRELAILLAAHPGVHLMYFCAPTSCRPPEDLMVKLRTRAEVHIVSFWWERLIENAVVNLCLYSPEGMPPEYLLNDELARKVAGQNIKVVAS